MAYLSPEYLQRYDTTSLSNRAYFSESKSAALHATVFLSHSSADKGHVERVKLFFKEHSAIAFADSDDPTLPKPPTVDTAEKLKTHIKNKSRFVIMVSSNSRDSRWIPWELGIADGEKGVAPVAVLPITSDGNEEEWTKEEYYKLYPRIKHNGKEWIVHDPRDNKFWTLDNWLHNAIG